MATTQPNVLAATEGPAALARRAVLVFLALAVPCVAAGWAWSRNFERNRLETIRLRETGYVRVAEQLIHRAIYEPLVDVTVASELPAVREWVERPSAGTERRASEALLALSRACARYHKIRIIGPDGHELVRVLRTGGISRIVPQDALQDKSDRYFFMEAMKLPPGRMYVSAVDLNVEHGAIELPPRPTMRFGKHLVASDGADRGVLLFNYEASELLGAIEAIGATEEHAPVTHLAMLLDDQGHWMAGAPQGIAEWGSPLGSDRPTFASLHPRIWETMVRQGSGRLRDDEGGLFIFAAVHPLLHGGPGDLAIEGDPAARFGIDERDAMACRWFVVLQVPPDSLQSTAIGGGTEWWALAALAIATLGAGSVGIAQLMLARERRERLTAGRAIELERQASTDPLTGIANRRHFESFAAHATERARILGKPLSMLALDLDHFKQVNDTYGHDGGDRVLRAFAQEVASSLRGSDLVARLGGEEFAVLLPDTDLDHGVMLAERIRVLSETMIIRLADGRTVSVTVSVGVAGARGDSAELERLMQLADRALYEAKQAGRNRVSVARG